MTEVDIRHGDCLTVLRELPDNSVDSIVTDPPYGLSNTKPAQVADVLAAWVTGNTEAVPTTKGGFMGKDWDSFVPPPAVWAECLRVLKPGGHMAVFAGSRTQDLMGISIRMAGFHVKDTLGWIYGSGMPKGMNVEKAVESTLLNGKSNSRTLRKTEQDGDGASYELKGRNNGILGENRTYDRKEFTSTTEEAGRWEGWNTQLKPAIEPIILAQKPLDGTVANNILAHGVGGLNIDASRVGNEKLPAQKAGQARLGTFERKNMVTPEREGRFPANVLLDEHAAKEMDKQSGVLKTGGYPEGGVLRTHNGIYGKPSAKGEAKFGASEGGASRFFPVFKYQAKAPKRERPVIERPPMLQLRDDLTPEQVDHVRARLQEAGIEIE